MVKLTPEADSNAISGHTYDTESRKMHVQFKGKDGTPGGTYVLDDVPPERYAAFTGAQSKGGFYAKRIAPFHTARKV